MATQLLFRPFAGAVQLWPSQNHSGPPRGEQHRGWAGIFFRGAAFKRRACVSALHVPNSQRLRLNLLSTTWPVWELKRLRKRRSGWLETPNPVIATLAERSDGNLKRNVYARYGSPGAQTPAIQALPGYPTACNTCPPRSWNLNVIRYQQLFIAPTSASWFH